MTLLGLDLSTRAAAGVLVPQDWDGQWSRVRSIITGEPLRRDARDVERARRTETVAAQLVAFAKLHGVTSAWIESYAYGQRTAAHTLGELGGVVRLELVRAGIEIRTANMSTARKLLLGKVPTRTSKDEPGRPTAKEAVQAALRAAGAPAWTPDEADAYVCANLGLSELGGFFFGQVA